jgi:hypothetical protein
MCVMGLGRSHAGENADSGREGGAQDPTGSNQERGKQRAYEGGEHSYPSPDGTEDMKRG